MESDSIVSFGSVFFLAFLLRLLNVTLPTHASVEEQDFGVKQELRMVFLHIQVLREMQNKAKSFLGLSQHLIR